MATPTLTRPSLRALAIEMARQHRDAGLFLDSASLLRSIDLLATGSKFERWAAVAAYQTVIAAGLPLDDQASADLECWYREEKWSE